MFIEPETNDAKPRLCTELDDAEKLTAFKLFLRKKFRICKGFRYGLALIWENKKIVLKDLQGNVIWQDEAESKREITRDKLSEMSKLSALGELERKLILGKIDGKADDFFCRLPQFWDADIYSDYVLIKDKKGQAICVAPPVYCGTYKWDMLPQILFNDSDLLRSFFSINPYGGCFSEIRSDDYPHNVTSHEFGNLYLNFVLERCLQEDKLDCYTLPFLCEFIVGESYRFMRSGTRIGKIKEVMAGPLSIGAVKKILGLLISEAPIGPGGTIYKGGIFAKYLNQSDPRSVEIYVARDYYLLIRDLDVDFGDLDKTSFSQDLKKAEDQMVKLCCNSWRNEFGSIEGQFIESIRELISTNQKGEKLSWCGEGKFFFEKLIESLQDQYNIGVNNNDQSRSESLGDWTVLIYACILNLPDKDKVELRQLRPALLKRLEEFVTKTLCNPQTNPVGYGMCRRRVRWDDKSREGVFGLPLDGSVKEVCDPAQKIKEKKEAVKSGQERETSERWMIYVTLSILFVGVAYLAYKYILPGNPQVMFSSLATQSPGPGAAK